MRAHSSLYRLQRAPASDFPGREPVPSEPATHFSPPIDNDGVEVPKKPKGGELITLALPVLTEPWMCQLEDSVDFPIDPGTNIANKYEIVDKLGSGSFSHAVQCREVASGREVCIKIVHNNKDFFDQALGEVKILQYLNRCDPEGKERLLRMQEFFYYKEHLFIVTELLRDNLYVLYRYTDSYFTLPRIASIARQTLQALDFLHRQHVYHCDLKPENILLASFSRCLIKVIDFGNSSFDSEAHSSYVQSRCYRAPEVVLGASYNHKIDIWSLGCILAELLRRRVLFKHDSVQTLLVSMISILGPLPQWLLSVGFHTKEFFTEDGRFYTMVPATAGKDGYFAYVTPTRSSLENVLGSDNQMFVDLIRQLLNTDHRQRPDAAQALQHPFLVQNEMESIEHKVWPELSTHSKATPVMQRKAEVQQIPKQSSQRLRFMASPCIAQSVTSDAGGVTQPVSRPAVAAASDSQNEPAASLDAAGSAQAAGANVASAASVAPLPESDSQTPNATAEPEAEDGIDNVATTDSTESFPSAPSRPSPPMDAGPLRSASPPKAGPGTPTLFREKVSRDRPVRSESDDSLLPLEPRRRSSLTQAYLTPDGDADFDLNQGVVHLAWKMRPSIGSRSKSESDTAGLAPLRIWGKRSSTGKPSRDIGSSNVSSRGPSRGPSRQPSRNLSRGNYRSASGSNSPQSQRASSGRTTEPDGEAASQSNDAEEEGGEQGVGSASNEVR